MIQYEILASMKKDRGVSWSYLESLIGGYRGKFVDYKKGKTTLTDGEEKKLADALNTTVEYLSGHSEQKNKPAAESGGLSAEERKIITLLRMVPPEDRKVLVGMIEGALRSRGLLK